jgi:hypothetical protein
LEEEGQEDDEEEDVDEDHPLTTQESDGTKPADKLTYPPIPGAHR